MKEKNELEFDVLSDAGNKVADAYGLVFELQENVKPLYVAAGSDLPQYNGDDSWTLPAAATFIIGQDLTVEYAFVEGDFTKRLESETILNELREIQLRGQASAA
jgi:peroxiredoxin